MECIKSIILKKKIKSLKINILSDIINIIFKILKFSDEISAIKYYLNMVIKYGPRAYNDSLKKVYRVFYFK